MIDDEADFASPNSKINKGEQTKINNLIEKLLGDNGIYIGVTATPARLDLNNTFDNDSDLWVNFPPHDKYTGQEIFFPIEGYSKSQKFQLNLLSDSGDNPKYTREALFRFLVNVAYLNLFKNDNPENYCMLIHTSGKKADHRVDRQIIEKAFLELNNQNSPKFPTHAEKIWKIASDKFPGQENDITKYVIDNASCYSILVMNSERDKNTDFKSATSPATLFTIAIGGNIVSRGVTFNNLLSMFFTRDVKHKIQQDTYIQRARMFGGRGDYLDYFELTIPEQLYLDWHRCFVFHRLALTAIKEGKGSPVWLADKRVSAVATTSIDKSTVSMDRGEMAFSIFKYDESLEEIIDEDVSVFDRLNNLRKKIGEDSFPEYLISFIRRVCPDDDKSVALHPSSSIENYKKADGLDKEKIERKKGFFGSPQMQREKHPKAVHHLKIFFNGKGKARLFYKFDGSIQFIKNLHKSLISNSVQ